MTWDWRPTMADPKHPRHYDEAFKRQIVQSCESGKPSREIRAECDIARSTPRRWVQGIRDSGSARAERAGRAGEARQAVGDGGGRFQNKRRRYSHEGRRDTGLRGEAREPGLVGPRHVRFGPPARIRARMPRSHMMPPMRLPDAVTPTAHQQYFVSSFRLEGLPIIWRKI